MKWKEINNNHVFQDGSVVSQKHQTHLYDCYKLYYNNKEITLSKDHIIKVNISKLPIEAQNEVKQLCNGQVPLEEDIEIHSVDSLSEDERKLIAQYFVDGTNNNIEVEDISEEHTECYLIKFPKKPFSSQVFIKRIPKEWENQKIDDNNYWVPIEGVAYLFNKYGKLQIDIDTCIANIEPVGKLPCFCVSTNTGRYKLNGLTHHNSVTVQNAILHCIEHKDKIALALIDPKMVEFSNYKGMNGIVGVANSTREAVELLRISRAAMKKRNTEMMKMGIKNLTDYKPHIKTGKVFVTGREFNETDMVQVRIDGQEQQMTAAELVEFLKE